jgi:hypothetical protein
MNQQAVILEALRQAERLTVAGKFRDVAELLADCLGLIKHGHKAGEPRIPGVHVNTRKGYMIIGCRGIVPDEIEATPAAQLRPLTAEEKDDGQAMLHGAGEFEAPTVNVKTECPECGEAVEGEACTKCGLVIGSEPRTFYDVAEAPAYSDNPADIPPEMRG